MKVAAILLSTILVQAKHVEKREVPLGSLCHDGPEICISVNDFKASCDPTKQMQYILTKSKDEDQKIIKKRGDDLKDATKNLESFHRQVPLWYFNHEGARHRRKPLGRRSEGSQP